MQKQTEGKAAVKVGFFKKLSQAYKAKQDKKTLEKLFSYAKENGLCLVKIVKRGPSRYIELPGGQLIRLGR